MENDKTIPRFICKKCDYFTNKKSSYINHLNSNKHTNISQISHKSWHCLCGKEYKHAPGLSRHKKNCNYINENQKLHMIL